MKIKHLIAILVPTFSALAQLQAQTTITAIYGSGNPDNGWSASSTNSVQLALRGKDRDSGNVPWSAGGIYNFVGGPSSINPARSSVNWEFSITTPSGVLGDFTYKLSIDTDPTAGTNFLSLGNPLTFYADNSFGISTTGNGLGDEGLFSAFSSATVGQNSQNFAFFPFAAGANITGSFDLLLEAYSPNQRSPVSSVQIQINIGQTLTAVPEPSTYGLFGALALVGLAGFRRLKKSSTR